MRPEAPRLFMFSHDRRPRGVSCWVFCHVCDTLFPMTTRCMAVNCGREACLAKAVACRVLEY
jgi:hypothetical protein